MKQKNKYRSSSKRRTPWDDRKDVSPVEFFISQEYKEHYNQHHIKLIRSNEEKLLNSFVMQQCKLCQSKNIKKKGFTSNHIQRYYCNDCGKSFTPVTNTIFEDHKLSISEWIEYILNLFHYSSLNLNSKVNKNAFSTSKYWLAKLFLILEDYQENIILKDNVQIDETFYTVIKSNIQTNNGKKLRGLSKNKICIAVRGR